MNKIPNRQAICQTLMSHAENDKDIVALCSDSRGSASMTPFFNEFPEQSVEVGIAEQNLVSISAGMARLGKKPFCFSPACFLSTRSYEQAKIDVAYSNTNVKLIGISGGISYGELGMSHHSAQDIAAMSAIPNMRVYIPSDRHQTAHLVEALLGDQKPAYVRVGRNPVEDIYSETDCPFEMDMAVVFGTDGKAKVAETEVEETTARETHSKSMQQDRSCDSKTLDVTIISCGEMVRPSLEAAAKLNVEGIKTEVIDMYCLKPMDKNAVVSAAKKSKLIITMEEHAPIGGMGSAVAQIVAAEALARVITMALPDDHVITGKSQAVFDFYKLNAEGIIENAHKYL